MSSSQEPERTSDEEAKARSGGGRVPAITAASILGVILAATIVVVVFAVRGEGSEGSETRTDLAMPLPKPSATPPGQLEISGKIAKALEQAQQQAPLSVCAEGPLVGTVSEVTSAATIRIVASDCSAAIAYAGVRGFDSGIDLHEAAARNVALVSGRNVVAEPDVTGSLRSGTQVLHVFVDGLLVSEQLVRLGVLRVDAESPDNLYRDRLMAAQQEAQDARRGGWKSSVDAAPPPIAASIARSEFFGHLEIVAINPFGEVVTIRNASAAAIHIGDWVLVASDFPVRFRFPDGMTLQPGASLQIVSGTPGAPSDRLFWTSDHVWRDDQSDTAQILDANNRVVSSYPP